MVIIDETLGGDLISQRVLESLTERMTVREIIRARIWQEVQEYNSGQRSEEFQGLIRPNVRRTILGSLRRVRCSPIDWEQQFLAATNAFEKNGFFMLVGDEQATHLDDEFVVEPETAVSFVKLVPLVGG